MRECDQKPVRTPLQNKALHKYYSLLADSLNNSRLDVMTVLSNKVEIEWTSDLIELFSKELAESLNNSGLKFRCVLGAEYTGARIGWNWKRVKELIWRKVQIFQFQIESTTMLDTEQVTKVYEVVDRHLSENHLKFVSVPFPEDKNKNEQNNKERER